jgi:EAL domain-containing protein (putative c-di-GMP-specific phosphodiesterase class I)
MIIDHSFIKDLPDNEEDRAITQAIIALAKSLNLILIAEEVETGEQMVYLRSIGCYIIQGYFYSQPVDRERMGHYIINSLV